jgi:hypothetical protein
MWTGVHSAFRASKGGVVCLCVCCVPICEPVFIVRSALPKAGISLSLSNPPLPAAYPMSHSISLNPKPWTLNPNLNPEPWTLSLNPKHWTSTRNKHPSQHPFARPTLYFTLCYFTLRYFTLPKPETLNSNTFFAAICWSNSLRSQTSTSLKSGAGTYKTKQKNIKSFHQSDKRRRGLFQGLGLRV